jgi:hypothetical protein
MEDAAYKVYFEGDADRADAALTQLLLYLDRLPDQKSYQIAKNTGKMYALARLQFVRAFKSKTAMNFDGAVKAFVAVQQLEGTHDTDELHVARKLVEMVRVMDGPRVPWANENFVSEANAVIDRVASNPGVK